MKKVLNATLDTLQIHPGKMFFFKYFLVPSYIFNGASQILPVSLPYE